MFDGWCGAWGGSRREFLRIAASGAAALGLAGSLTGCVLATGRRKLDFRDDGVSNRTYAHEVQQRRFFRRAPGVLRGEIPPPHLSSIAHASQRAQRTGGLGSML